MPETNALNFSVVDEPNQVVSVQYMKVDRVKELREKLEQISRTECSDSIVQLARINVTDRLGVLDLPDHPGVKITQHAAKQLYGALKIPGNYLQKCIGRDPVEATKQLQYWLRESEETMLFRLRKSSSDTFIRGVLKSNFAGYPNHLLLESVIQHMERMGADAEYGVLTDNMVDNMLASVWYPTVHDFSGPDKAKGGASLVSSEVGAYNFAVCGAHLNLSCFNQARMIATKRGMKRVAYRESSIANIPIYLNEILNQVETDFPAFNQAAASLAEKAETPEGLAKFLTLTRVSGAVATVIVELFSTRPGTKLSAWNSITEVCKTMPPKIQNQMLTIAGSYIYENTNLRPATDETEAA